jgi:hypothetical protein
VGRAGRDRQRLARGGDGLLAADLEPECARDDREPLLLLGVDVRGRDEPVRLDEGLEDDRLAVRLPGDLVEEDPLPRDGILDYVTCTNRVLLSFCRPPLGGWFGTRRTLRLARHEIVARRPDLR